MSDVDDRNDHLADRAWQPHDAHPLAHVARLDTVTNGYGRPDESTDASGPMPIEVSVIAPVFNEAGNLGPLHDSIVAAMWTLHRTFEVIYVDDGSSDNSYNELA